MYNYAAQRGQIPIVSVERNDRHRRSAVAIDLPGLGVVAKRSGTSLQAAMIQASAFAKQTIESALADRAVPSEDTARDLTRISTANAKQFLDFIKQQGRRFGLSTRVEDTTKIYRDGGTCFEGTAVIDGSPLNQKVCAVIYSRPAASPVSSELPSDTFDHSTDFI